jgi:hypothetical protein
VYPVGNFILPDGSIFDHDIGLGPVADMPQKFSWSELLKDTKAVLKRYGYKPSMVENFSMLASEVGDDNRV